MALLVKTEPVQVVVSRWYWVGSYPWGKCIAYQYRRFVRFNHDIRCIVRCHRLAHRPPFHGGRVSHYFVDLQWTCYRESFFKTYRAALEAALNDMLQEKPNRVQ